MSTIKWILCSLIAVVGLPLLAADSTINNLPAITTVPDAYVMPWEWPGVSDVHITFSNLTNQILAGYASQGYAQGMTNGYPWTNLTVAHAGAVTNGWPWTNLTVAHAGAVTNGYGWTNLTVAHAGAVTNGYIWTNLSSYVTNGYPWTNLTVAHAGAVTNGFPWTNLTVAHAGAVTNGYPWTNVSFVNATSWVGTLYYPISNPSNYVTAAGVGAPLNGTNVWTGTNTFNVTVLGTITNATVAQLAPDGFGVASTNYVNAAMAGVGRYMYFTSVTNSGALDGRTNNWQAWSGPTTTISTQTFSGLTVDAYIRHNVSTQLFTRVLEGPASVSSYPYRTGGSGTVSMHSEIYAYDTVSNVLYELAASPAQVVSATTPTRLEFSMSIPATFTPTNATKVAVAFKIDSAGVGGPTLSFVNGGGYDAHASFVQALSDVTIAGSQVIGPVSSASAVEPGVTNAWQTYARGMTNGYPWTNLTVAHASAVTNGWGWTNLTVAHAGAVTNGWPWTNLTVAHAGAVTNGYGWTNLTVAHAGAVTNGYPWTNVPVAQAMHATNADTATTVLALGTPVETYGAAGDALVITNCYLTNATMLLVCSNTTFVAGDTGKVCLVIGAGAGGAALSTFITQYVSASSVMLSNAASTTVTNTPAIYGHDDTEAFQTGLNQITNGTFVLYAAAKGYIINGQLQDIGDSSHKNAQLILPNILYHGGYGPTISIRGKECPAMLFNASGTERQWANPGTTLFSTYVSTVNTGAFFNAQSSIASWFSGSANMSPYQNNCGVRFENIAIQLVPNPSISGLRLGNAAQASVKNVGLQCGYPEFGTAGAQTYSGSIGLEMPQAFTAGGGYNEADQCFVYGFYTAFALAEHTHVLTACAVAGRVGVRFNPGYHPLLIDDFYLGGFKTNFSGQFAYEAAGAPYCRVKIQKAAIEHWTTSAFSTVYDVYDPSSYLKGELHWTIVKSGAGITNDWTYLGSTNLIMTEFGSYPAIPLTPWTTDINAGGKSLTNANQITVTNGIFVTGTFYTPASMANGAIQLWNSNGVLYALCKDTGGTLTTNKLAP